MCDRTEGNLPKPEKPAPIPEFDDLLESIMNDTSNEHQYIHSWGFSISLNECPTYKRIKSLTPRQKAQFSHYISELIYTLAWADESRPSDERQLCEPIIFKEILKNLLRMKMDFEDTEIAGLFTHIRNNSRQVVEGRRDTFNKWPIASMATQFEHHIKNNGLNDGLKSFIEESVEWPEFAEDSYSWGSDIQKAKFKLVKLAHDPSDTGKSAPRFKAHEGDVFGKQFNEAIEGTDGEFRQVLYEICHLAVTASGGKPSKNYLETARGIISKTKPDNYRAFVSNWLEHLITSEPVEEIVTYGEEPHVHTYTTRTFLGGKNQELLKGLIWSFAQFHDNATLDLLARLAERSFRKIPHIGPTCGAVGNACIYTLSASKGLMGISHLSRLRLKITQNNTRNLIDKYIKEGSAKRGISASELEDMAVPEFGLVNGVREETIEGYTLRLTVSGVGKTKIEWFTPEGKPQKSTPAAAKKKSKNEEKITRIKSIAKQIQKYSTAHRDRLDRSFLEDREWTYENFSKYYFDHGLVCFIARRLIWVFDIQDTRIAVLYSGGRWTDLEGNEVSGIDGNTKVKLWHPIHADTDEVMRWRDRLEQLQLQQPVKQAHREVYIVTDAELNTRFYSNRMAAHILKQHQLNSLTSVRGWKYTLIGAFDYGGNEGSRAIKEIPEHKIRCEYWIDELPGNDDVNDSGIYNHVSTDQVRFISETGSPINLIDVPKIVFSEMMRDVDLFVGVCSVANDPAWRDNGGEARHQEYWQSYSFGNLNEMARTRKQVLERLIPRLKIRDVTRIDGKFLRVKGTVREYKIHIGSTNILMEPNDQYLCIVPSRGEPNVGKNIFLPFEGDRGLSLVISKAMLLAADEKITDPSILSQIHLK